MMTGRPFPRPEAPAGRSPSDATTNLILLAAALAGALGVALWLATQLAALVSGHGWLSLSMAEAGSAFVRLPRTLSDPAGAWPPEVGNSLPGPTRYYLCVAVVVGFANGLGVVAVRVRQLHSSARIHPLGVRPNAGFARLRDLQRLVVRNPETGRLTLGRLGRHLVACEPQTSLAVVGPTGCGKTVGFAVPAILEWEGPIIATSVKADLIQATIRHRQRAGSVWVYDPTGCSAHDGCSWSPLAACDTWAGAMRTAAWISEAGQPRVDTLSDADYWYSQARKGLAPYLYAAGKSGGTMRDVVRWVDSQEVDEVQQILETALNVDPEVEEYIGSEAGSERRQAVEKEIRPKTIKAIRRILKGSGRGRAVAYADQPVSAWPIAKQEQLDERIRIEADKQMRTDLTNELQSELRRSGTPEPLIAAQALWNKEPRLRGSVFATIENVLSGYADPTVCAAAEHCDIDFNEWLASDSTIYVVATAHEQARLRPVLTVLVQQAIRAAYDTAAASGGTLAKPCLVMLDEAGNTAPLRDLPGYAATARSHGITFVSIWQDLAQVKAIYHERAQTVINNHRAKLFGTGIADEATLEYVSRLVGDEPRTDRNLSADLHGGRRTLSEHTSYRRVAPVDVVRRIRPNDAVLLYGSELPVHVRLRPWHLDTELRRRSTGVTSATCVSTLPSDP